MMTQAEREEAERRGRAAAAAMAPVIDAFMGGAVAKPRAKPKPRSKPAAAAAAVHRVRIVDEVDDDLTPAELERFRIMKKPAAPRKRPAPVAKPAAAVPRPTAPSFLESRGLAHKPPAPSSSSSSSSSSASARVVVLPPPVVLPAVPASSSSSSASASKRQAVPVARADKELPICPVCLETFDNVTQALKPRALGCLHWVCNTCLPQLNTDWQGIQCPQCKTIDRRNDEFIVVDFRLCEKIAKQKKRLAAQSSGNCSVPLDTDLNALAAILAQEASAEHAVCARHESAECTRYCGSCERDICNQCFSCPEQGCYRHHNATVTSAQLSAELAEATPSGRASASLVIDTNMAVLHGIKERTERAHEKLSEELDGLVQALRAASDNLERRLQQAYQTQTTSNEVVLQSYVFARTQAMAHFKKASELRESATGQASMALGRCNPRRMRQLLSIIKSCDLVLKKIDAHTDHSDEFMSSHYHPGRDYFVEINLNSMSELLIEARSHETTASICLSPFDHSQDPSALPAPEAWD